MQRPRRVIRGNEPNTFILEEVKRKELKPFPLDLNLVVITAEVNAISNLELIALKAADVESEIYSEFAKTCLAKIYGDGLSIHTYSNPKIGDFKYRLFDWLQGEMILR